MPAAAPPQPCHFRYTHIATDGFGGSFNQILNGKVTAALRGLAFCLDTPVDLQDLNDWHGGDNGWLRGYWDGVPRCPAAVSACDALAVHVHEDWQTPFVWRLWQLFYPAEFVRLRARLTASPLSRGHEHCAHVRTGDDQSLPSVPISNVTLHLFGTSHTDYEFCARNACVLVNRANGSVEADFVNMLNCAHLYACESSLSKSAKLLSPHNAEYVQAARLSNTRYTQYFSSTWAPQGPPGGCDAFPVGAEEYAILYAAAGRPRG